MTPIEKSVDMEEDRGGHVGTGVHLIIRFYTISCYTVQSKRMGRISCEEALSGRSNGKDFGLCRLPRI